MKRVEDVTQGLFALEVLFVFTLKGLESEGVRD
jgi:hypothetical protein